MIIQRKYTQFGLIGFLVVVVVCPTAVWADVKLSPKENWTTVFADTSVKLHVVATTKHDFTGRVVWTFAAANKRVFPGGRGEKIISVKAGNSAEITVPLRIPPVKPGIVLAGILRVSAVAKGQSKIDAVLERKLWIFHENPFADRTKWRDQKEITVYDPTTNGDTVNLLRKYEIQYEEFRNPAALDDVKDGILLIGEGLSFAAERGLEEHLTKAAKRGVAVLCLAPKDGIIHLPGTAESTSMPQKMRWRKADVISELNKHLDALAWPKRKSIVASSLIVKSDGGRVVAEFVQGEAGWPWLEMEYERKTKCLIVGFPLISEWQSSPTPRYLFARLLDYVSPEPKQSKPAKE